MADRTASLHKPCEIKVGKALMSLLLHSTRGYIMVVFAEKVPERSASGNACHAVQ